MKTRRTLKEKLLAVLLALAMLLPAVPNLGMVDTAAAASAYTLHEANASGGDGDAYRFKSGKFMQIYVVRYNSSMDRRDAHIERNGSATEAHEPIKMYTARGEENYLLYCLEHGVIHKENTLYKRNYLESAVYHAYNNFTGKKKPYPLENVYKVLMMAPVKESNMQELYDMGFQQYHDYDPGKRYTITDWYVASQMLVWECQQMMRTEKFVREANGNRYETGHRTGVYTSKIPADHYLNNLAGTNAKDIYNFMASTIKKRENFDRKIASGFENKPAKISLTEEESKKDVITKTITAGSYRGEYKVVDSKGKELKGVKIAYDEANKKYTITITDKSLLGKKLEIKHVDAVSERAEKYIKQYGSKYNRYVWEHATKSGHTQGFISGLNDPTSGWLMITPKDGPEPQAEFCVPPEVEYFPTLSMPIEKVDANVGWDGNNHTPLGGAGLDATYTLERQIGAGAWETIDVRTLDDFGTAYTFSDQPFKTAADLAPYLTESDPITACDHPIYAGDPPAIVGYQHNGSKWGKRVWDVTVNYRITETRPDGRYIDPDQYAGVRTYTFSYHAESEDTCTFYCHGDPWNPIRYTFPYQTTTGAGGAYQEGETETPNEDLSYDQETFVNDEFRGELLIIKSNEQENPFKDSAQGGDKSNISRASYWTIKLLDGFEGVEYVHLKSETPAVSAEGTHIFTASRGVGVANNTLNGGLGMKVGTNGQILLRDLPYGTYELTEVKADNPKFVLERTIVVVSEHDNGAAKRIPYGTQGSVPANGAYAGYGTNGTNAIGASANGTGDFFNNRYQLNIRDKIKENVIKIVKVDSETGKQIPLKGTKIFIRYKGNPDLTDEENEKAFGPGGTVSKDILNRFLPNAESINSKSTNYTFELDENGETIIPYELPYGKYEVYEWLLPDGYFVGEYGVDGQGKNHNFGYIEDGVLKFGDTGKYGDHYTGDGHQYEDVVAIYDADGNKVVYKDKDQYSFAELDQMVTNRYTFTVTEQDMHVDGNYSQLITSNGHAEDADPAYDNSNFPYKKYYRLMGVLNNSVKGKIEITKEGEALVGFQKEEKDGHTILTPVFEKVAKLKNAVFGIFAAVDENLNDGGEGPDIYDAKTDEKITIPKKLSTHLSNAVETVKAFAWKLLSPKEYPNKKNYETGSYSHDSGAELWYMLEREASEGNVKRTIYVSPEQKDTTYTYVYETQDEAYRYRYDVEVILKNQAGGRNVTKVNVIKTTSPLDGSVPEIPMTYMHGMVGTESVDDAKGEIQSYEKDKIDEFDWTVVSELDVYKKLYVFEADGENDVFIDGVDTDLAKYSAKRYLVKDYLYYKLTADDLKTEERDVTKTVIDQPGIDANGDGSYDGPDDTPPTYKDETVKVTKTKFEWDNEGWELTGNPAAGDHAILKQTEGGETKYKTAVTGYYVKGEKTDLSQGIGYAFIETDAAGKELPPYTIPTEEGWSKLPFTGDAKNDPQYVIISKLDAETGSTIYRVLLNDLVSWQACTADGNFEQMRVQVYEATYKQEKDDPDGVTIDFDGLVVDAKADPEAGVATTVITKQAVGVAETVDVGIGYEQENAPGVITFRTVPISAPVYFSWQDGTKADMYYKGGVCYATIKMPASAVDHLYEDIVPTLNFMHYDSEGNKVPLKLDWYSTLSPTKPRVEFTSRDGLSDGITVVAKRIESLEAGGETMYAIEIVTNQGEDTPLELTFADGYTMDIYCAETASGSGVGVLDLANVYKTTRYTQSHLIETITTDANGKATSKLLPLGKYIIRELAAGEKYLNDSKEQLVELKYKNQFTPLVWNLNTFENQYFTAQLDLSKILETGFQSSQYKPPQPGQVVKFGLYAAEEIKAAHSGILKVFTKKIKKDTLLDVFTITYEENGSILVNTKLPEGRYYLKEMKTTEDHILSDLKYHFAVKEEAGDYSGDTAFDYVKHDGIYGRFVLEEKHHVKTIIMVEARLPMPAISIDGLSYPLDEDFASIDEKIKITANTDYTEITVDTKKGETTNITLPNGKVLTVKPSESGNGFDYTADGVTKTFTPRGTYTGYHAAYEELWTPVAGEDLNTYTPEFTLTGAGSDKANVVLNAKITHEPSVTITTREELIDPAKPELGFQTVDVKTGNLTPKGNQIFQHSAVISVTNGVDNVIQQTFTRTSGKKSVTETLDPSGLITLNTKDKLTLSLIGTDAVVTVSMDKYGVVSAKIENVLPGLFLEDAHPQITSTGAFDTAKTFRFAKNVTLGRQDTSADKLMIKFNSDNKDGFAIENEHKPEVEFVKVDKDDTNKKLSGAVFEIWSAKESGEWTVEPDVKLGTYTTDANGHFIANLDYGIYFWREVQAPAGYAPEDYDYHSFRIIKGIPKYQFVIGNVKTPPPPTPNISTYQIELKKVDKETRESLAGAEFELWSAKLADDGITLVPDAKLVTKNMVTGQYGIARVTVSHKGKFFYREVKAPTGYEADTDFHLIDTSTTVDLITRVEVENEKTTEPFIRTSAAGIEGLKEIPVGTRSVIVDTVTYYNLIPGKTYTMKGTIMDQATGRAIMVGGKKVTQEKNFTPAEPNGTVTLKFTFDAGDFAGKKLVVYERLYLNDELIAKHTDIGDENQTVKMIRKDGRIEFETDRGDDDDGTIGIVPKTGDNAPLKWMILLMLASAFGIFAAMIKRKKE